MEDKFTKEQLDKMTTDKIEIQPDCIKPTKEEVERALKTTDGIFLIAGIHGFTTPDPDVIKLFNWIKAEFKIERKQ